MAGRGRTGGKEGGSRTSTEEAREEEEVGR